jgi:hypothetical protein
MYIFKLKSLLTKTCVNDICEDRKQIGELIGDTGANR